VREKQSEIKQSGCHQFLLVEKGNFMFRRSSA
jgi:hypothetical protein